MKKIEGQNLYANYPQTPPEELEGGGRRKGSSRSEHTRVRCGRIKKNVVKKMWSQKKIEGQNLYANYPQTPPEELEGGGRSPPNF